MCRGCHDIKAWSVVVVKVVVVLWKGAVVVVGTMESVTWWLECSKLGGGRESAGEYGVEVGWAATKESIGRYCRM